MTYHIIASFISGLWLGYLIGMLVFVQYKLYVNEVLLGGIKRARSEKNRSSLKELRNCLEKTA